VALKNICVKVASGAKVMCTQMWKNFKCKMQGKWFHIDVYILTLGSYDVILDAQWLYELGNIVWNVKELWTKFVLNGEKF
jgi:hypothetical protein